MNTALHEWAERGAQGLGIHVWTVHEDILRGVAA